VKSTTQPILTKCPTGSNRLNLYKHVLKRKTCPCAELIKHYTMKAYGGVDVKLKFS
jgi:hypothetical protein